jgi:hypothetical protein
MMLRSVCYVEKGKYLFANTMFVRESTAEDRKMFDKTGGVAILPKAHYPTAAMIQEN